MRSLCDIRNRSDTSILYFLKCELMILGTEIITQCVDKLVISPTWILGLRLNGF